jgi:hypothetical protein
LEHERNMILLESHEGITEGKYVGKYIVQKVFHVGLWWTIVHEDAKEYFQKCDV